MNRFSIGRWLFSLNVLIVGVGGFLADWNATHLSNPNWPPHAKFHNGQTMATGVLLALASLFFVWRRSGDRKTNVLAAVIFGVMLYWTQAAANLFPRTAWTDPEFLTSGQSLTDFSPQIYLDLGMTVLVLFSAWLTWPTTVDSDKRGQLPTHIQAKVD